jgi:TolB-like protein
MTDNQNKLSQFWQELKRRRVVHVIVVYATAAFVIIELVNNVYEPLRLPDWTPTLVILILAIGFPLAVIFSWIFDVTPEGIEKTKPAHKLSKEDKPVSSKGWKIASYISFFVIVALIILNIIPRSGESKEISILEKSIAVLPFKYLSDDPEKQYLADGMMDAILLHLSKIEDLRVMSRTSVEQYRGTIKTTRSIGQELDVEYLLEGSFQKFGEDVRLIVQLIKTSEESHVWANEYNSKWSEIFFIQGEVAQTIARELHAEITPEEKQLIEKIPTTDTTAYNLYLKANDYYNEYLKTFDLSFYQNADRLYNAALDIDPAFAKAYVGLANLIWGNQFSEGYFSESFLDSCLVLINIALSFDDQLDEAYFLKGRYYQENGHFDEALYNYDKALKINPNYYSAYQYKGRIFWYQRPDIVKCIDNSQQALNLIRGDERPNLLRTLGGTYLNVGFIEKAKQYYQEAFALDGNKARYLGSLAWLEFHLENYEEAYKLRKQSDEIDSTFRRGIVFYNLAPGHKEEAYELAQKYVEFHEKSGGLNLFESHQIGYAFWQVGKYREAENYFNQQIKYGEESIKLNRDIAQWGAAQYDLVCTYAFLGDTAKAYQYLDEFDKVNYFGLWWIGYAKHNPFIKSIRYNERYQKTLQNMEAKYQAEHERVRKWLEENDML